MAFTNPIQTSTLALSLPNQLTNMLRVDPDAIKQASTDHGHIVSDKPAAVLYPTSVDDIKSLINCSYTSPTPYTIAPKGQGHSVRGQAQARNGVVVEMSSLNDYRNGTGTVISRLPSGLAYADVGGEQRWVDVLNETLKQGLTPVSLTDYLFLSVGGTLSNAGIGGQTHRRGPQISNVLELDVLTGKGEFVTCSPQQNSELFYGVLGGLGQFGIITRARIVLEPAKPRAKWLRILYSDFASFRADQENLIAATAPGQTVPDYVEGHLLMSNNSLDFYPPSDHPRITSLINQHGIIYVIEVAIYYADTGNNSTADEKIGRLLKSLKDFVPGFVFEQDVTYFEFLNRLKKEEEALRAIGLWDIPHPWLNFFIPKSRISDFDSGVFRDILLKRNFTSSFVLVYPMFRNKWDDRMSAVIPDDDIFYTVEFFDASIDWEAFDDKNKEILQFCDTTGIKYKRYLARHETQKEWIDHFGSKWNTFQERKTQFDPKLILSPGQRIFQ